MAKVKIIRSESLVYLRSRINNNIDEAHRMIEQLDSEMQRNTKPETREMIVDQKNIWQTRINCYRQSLSSITEYTSEIEI